ncbi:MAG: hypothetical protein QOE11_1645, partial [Solirubrobacteraceae bacterium]|nr:hypothetical protein [Solirubrobacteraceae bacterium]
AVQDPDSRCCHDRRVTHRRLMLQCATAIAGLLVLAGCGSGARTATQPPAATTAAAPGSAATGRRLRGADYSLSIPAGWGQSRRNARTATVDRVITHRSPHAVVVIAMVRAPAGVSASKALRARARLELAGVGSTASTRPRFITLAGEPALTYQYRSTSPAGARVQGRQVLVAHGGNVHVIALTAGRAKFASLDTALGSILGSWRWSTG